MHDVLEEALLLLSFSLIYFLLLGSVTALLRGSKHVALAFDFAIAVLHVNAIMLIVSEEFSSHFPETVPKPDLVLKA